MPIHGFRLTHTETIPLEFTASSLDEMTAHLSDGFYTTFSTLSQGTRVFGLSTHLKRLYGPAKELRIMPSVNERTLCMHIAALTKTNLPNESRVRLILTKDTGDVYVGLQPFIPLSKEIYERGVHVITADMARHDPRIKGTDFISASAELRKLVKGDVFEILLTREEKILEGMTSNFYAVKAASLITAQKGILLGVTRRIVLRLARGQGMLIEYRFPHVSERIDEAFLTSSSRGVVPIISIDGHTVGEGKVGRFTEQLSAAYEAYIVRNAEKL